MNIIDGLLGQVTSGETDLDRRHFLRTTGKGLIGAAVLGAFANDNDALAQDKKGRSTGPDKVVNSADDKKPIELKPLDHTSEAEDAPLPNPLPPDKRIGIAIVGLGTLALNEVLPALSQCQYIKLTALVSGTPDKAKKVAREYGIGEQNIYSYDQFDEIRNNREIDAVYIILPNSLHEEYTMRAAKAGKHVLCEKPMANSAAQCRRMIKACEDAGKKLMVAYRIQYEPNHRQIRTWLQDEHWGKVRLIEAVNAQNIGDPAQWRLKRSLAGGGSLPDIGLYCLNTLRYLTGEEPKWVMANIYSTPGDARFKEVEESVMWQMQFPSGILSNCSTSYGVHESRRYRCYADRGACFGMDPAFPYDGLQMEVAEVRDGKEWKSHPNFGHKNQFALEMDHFAQCIMQDKTPFTPGEEGLQDQIIMEAIYESARSGRKVELGTASTKDAFRGWMG